MGGASTASTSTTPTTSRRDKVSKLDDLTFVYVETTYISTDDRHRVVSVARLGLLPQDGSNDDQTKEVPRRQGERRRQIEGEEKAIGKSISDPCERE